VFELERVEQAPQKLRSVVLLPAGHSFK